MSMTGLLEHGACFPTMTRSHYNLQNIYVDFVLRMHPEYTSTPSSFYGAGGRHSHARPGARRDSGAQPEAETLVGLPKNTLLRTRDVVDSSQLAIDERSALAR